MTRFSKQESPEREQKYLELWRHTDAAREAVWRSLGTLKEETITPIAMGGPLWPGHQQAWCVIHRPGGKTLLVTDGLSDPFYGQLEPSVGFGLELALETDGAMKAIWKRWPLTLLQRVGDEMAEHPHVREQVKEGLFSMEVSGEELPGALVTAEGRVAVLLGVESSTLPRSFTLPAGEVRLITVKVLLPPELAYLLEHGAEGQAELARRFVEQGEEHLSCVRRRPVV